MSSAVEAEQLKKCEWLYKELRSFILSLGKKSIRSPEPKILDKWQKLALKAIHLLTNMQESKNSSRKFKNELARLSVVTRQFCFKNYAVVKNVIDNGISKG